MNKPVRVRFAPSPTGPLHIGGVRTALYNYLFAKKYGGEFLLRIEDTDQGRFVPGAEEYIIESLRWAGIMPEEGVGAGGPHSPYRQSERKAIYRQFVEILVNKGYAYYAFDSPEELEKLRRELENAKAENTSYSLHVRKRMNNSLTLPETEVKHKLDSGEPYVIRMLIPENETIIGNDIIRGRIEVKTTTLDDKVLFKSDGLPTYHLANVVDDHLMGITHVIRGDEWLPSLPLHILLYKSFGWEEPEFAHLPLLLKPDGKGKLSKRDGDRLGFPVFPLLWKDPFTGEVSSGYREIGFEPDAFINMIVFLGWNPGTEQEIYSINELIDLFSLNHVHKGGAKFDFEKAKWFNQQYLLKLSDEELSLRFEKIIKQHSVNADLEYIKQVTLLIKSRISFINEMWQQGSFFFIQPQDYDAEAIKKVLKNNILHLTDQLIELITNIQPFSAEQFKEDIHLFASEKQFNLGSIMTFLRLACVGGLFGPDLPVIASLLGKEEVIKRIINLKDKIRILE